MIQSTIIHYASVKYNFEEVKHEQPGYYTLQDIKEDIFRVHVETLIQKHRLRAKRYERKNDQIRD
jgi:hypothetical protein